MLLQKQINQKQIYFSQKLDIFRQLIEDALSDWDIWQIRI